MDERIQPVPINEEITLLNDHNESTCYLVTGTRRAVLVDTANGFVDLRAYCAQLTPLPVTVVNTHGHGDHVYGNLFFEEAHLHPADVAIHDAHFRFPNIARSMAQTGLRPARLVPLAAGEVFDLGGGHTLETVALAGHTPGSIGLLDRKHRILFSGDGVLAHLWMQLEESLPIAALRDMLRTLKAEHGREFDFLLTGHGRGLEPASLVDGLIRGCDTLLAGQRAQDRPYPCFLGERSAHPFDEDPNHCIVYDQNRL